jgi:hypothetical protein
MGKAEKASVFNGRPGGVCRPCAIQPKSAPAMLSMAVL